MKRLANYQHPTRTQYPQLPPGLEDPLKVIGKQIQEITELLQGLLTLEGNGNYEKRTVTVRHDQEFTLGLLSLRGPPEGVVAIHSTAREVPEVKDFTVLSEKSIRLKVFFRHSVPAGDVAVRFLILGA